MRFDLAELAPAERCRPLGGLVAPRPIALVRTCSTGGHDNTRQAASGTIAGSATCTTRSIAAGAGWTPYHHEVLTILLRIGAMAVVLDEDERHTEAVFDYTLPDNLNYRPDDSFCVHPIFVEEYRVVDPRKNGAIRPVYPSGSEVDFA